MINPVHLPTVINIINRRDNSQVDLLISGIGGHTVEYSNSMFRVVIPLNEGVYDIDTDSGRRG